MHFKNLKLGTKQIIGFGTVLIIMATGHYFSINAIRDLRADIDDVSESRLPRVITTSDLNINTTKLRLLQVQHAYATDEKTKGAYANDMIDLIDRINENQDADDCFDELKRRDILSQEEINLCDDFDNKWETYQDLSQKMLVLARNEPAKVIGLLNGDASSVYASFSEDLVKLVGLHKEDALAAAKRAEVTYKATHGTMITLIIVTIFLFVVIAIILARFVTAPVKQLSQAAGQVARGDLDVQLEVKSNDEIGHLTESFNHMTASLDAANKKTQSQAAKLQKQHAELQTANANLEEKSNHLESQKAEIEQKNHELEDAFIQLKQTQDQLIMNEKMASLGNLVAGVAHEVNTPIGAVHSAADVSRRCIDKIKDVMTASETLDQVRDSGQYQKSFKILQANNDVTIEASQRITRIVKSLKTFARLDEAEFLSADVHDGLDSTLTLINHEIKNRIRVAKEYGAIPKINCYPNQLNQVFMNILVNAVQAITAKGEIMIKTLQDNDNIVIAISDTGSGIAAENLSRIFNPGFTTRGVGVGTGLGLSLSYKIIQKHHGDIQVHSEPGKGTTFTITLPVTQEQNAL